MLLLMAKLTKIWQNNSQNNHEMLPNNLKKKSVIGSIKIYELRDKHKVK